MSELAAPDAMPPASGAPPVRQRRRWVFPLLLAIAAAIWLILGPRLPKDQTLHVVLGSLAPRVVEIHVRYAPAADPDVFDRDVTLKFAAGEAPRIVTHTPRLADGDYHVEIEVLF